MTRSEPAGASTAIGRRSLLGNFLSLSAATWVAQALGFLVVVYLAREVGAGALGQVALAQAIVLQFRFVADMGFDLLGSRRIAADRAAAPATVADLTGARLLNAAIAGGALAAVALAADRFVPVGWMTAVFGLSLVCWALSVEWAFMGLERMDLVGLARLTAAAVWLLLVLAFVRGGTPLVVVPAAYVAGQACGAGLLFARFRRAHGPVRLRCRHVAWLAALRQAAPIGLSFVVIQIHVGFGLVALGLFDGDRAAGLYAAPQRLVLFLTAVSSMFGAAVYPRLSALWAGGERSSSGWCGWGSASWCSRACRWRSAACWWPGRSSTSSTGPATKTARRCFAGSCPASCPSTSACCSDTPFSRQAASGGISWCPCPAPRSSSRRTSC